MNNLLFGYVYCVECVEVLLHVYYKSSQNSIFFILLMDMGLESGSGLIREVSLSYITTVKVTKERTKICLFGWTGKDHLIASY